MSFKVLCLVFVVFSFAYCQSDKIPNCCNTENGICKGCCNSYTLYFGKCYPCADKHCLKCNITKDQVQTAQTSRLLPEDHLLAKSELTLDPKKNFCVECVHDSSIEYDEKTHKCNEKPKQSIVKYIIIAGVVIAVIAGVGVLVFLFVIKKKNKGSTVTDGSYQSQPQEA